MIQASPTATARIGHPLVHHGKRLLDPIDRFSEILFGLIMVLSFTGSVSVATSARREVWTMLIGAIGCNLAWGIVDAVMYLVGCVTQARREEATVRALVAAGSAAEARHLLSPGLHPELAAALTDEELERIRQRLGSRPRSTDTGILTRKDVAAAVLVFAIVVLSTFPVIIPFIVFTDAATAVRISNGIALAMLFIAGRTLGRLSGIAPWKAGTVMAAIGVVLVAITMALGG